ncbi:MAG: HK97 family phage prohead protease [Chloroflexota bacterium]
MNETKRVPAHDLKLTESGDITLAFAQLDVVDHDGDVTVAGAIPTKDVAMSAYGHTSWDGALPVGRGTVKEAGGWGVFSGRFLMDTDQGRNTYNTVKAMAELQEYSYGYGVTKASFGVKDGVNVRYLEGLDIFEVSPVLAGAGIGTHTMSIKGGGPGPGLPYADALDGIVREAKALIERSRERAELRAKDGRLLSAASRDRLAALGDALEALGVDLASLLDETDPTKAARLAAARDEWLRDVARSAGITV